MSVVKRVFVAGGGWCWSFGAAAEGAVRRPSGPPDHPGAPRVGVLQAQKNDDGKMKKGVYRYPGSTRGPLDFRTSRLDFQ